MNLAGLPPELTTAAWQAAYAALGYTNPAEEFRDSNISIAPACRHNRTWVAEFRCFWPCCGIYSHGCAVDTRGDLDDLAATIRIGLATHDEPCPNADIHASKDRP